MPTTQTNILEVYEVTNGVSVLVESIETLTEVPTKEEIIAQKEAEMLAMYDEIQRLKQT
tara:strand:- start:675 stop:851 length:177 start_codon:yes stop_codon:yes gene_type:complete